MTIDWRATKRDWKHHAEREMLRRSEWWESVGNKRLSIEYLAAIDEMNRSLSGVNTLVEDDYLDN